MVRFRKRIINATEAVKLALGPERFFNDEHIPAELFRENHVIHQMLGADNTEEVELKLGEWTVKGIPDKVFDNAVIRSRFRGLFQSRRSF